jgi:hypothetical protein
VLSISSSHRAQALYFQKEGNAVSQGQAIAAIVVGSILIIASFFAKSFYAARGIPMPTASDRKIPIWQGRLMFWVIGGMMILGGLISLFPNR